MKKKKISHVFVTLSYEATHCWPECPIEEVSFLKNPHRHLFLIKCMKLVSHNDRQIEIIMLKRAVGNYLHLKYDGDLGRMSCEDLASELIDVFELASCQVLEDGENGAFVMEVNECENKKEGKPE